MPDDDKTPDGVSLNAPSEPITLTGVWDDGRETCISCGQRFTPGPEGTAIATETISGRRLGPVCPACGTALVS